MKSEDRKLPSERLLFKPYPKQQQFIDAVFSGKYTFLTYGGAMGGGKSMVNIATMILLCKFYPGSKWVIIRDSVPTLKSTTLETFNRIVPTNFLKSFNQQDHIAEFTNGSRIIFMAENFHQDKKFDRFKGLEVNGFLLEQLEELQEGLLDVCFNRAGRWKIEATEEQRKAGINPMPKPLIMGNVNPTLLWPKNRVYDPWMKGNLPKGWYYLPATIVDNPTLADDAEYMANQRMMDETTYRRNILGDWTAFAVDNPFFYKFDHARHVIDSYIPNRHLPITISFDFNVEPMTALIGQRVDLWQSYAFDEIHLAVGSSEEVCEIIKARYPQWIGNMNITGDATGRNRTAVTRGNLNHYKVIKQQLDLLDRDILVPTQNMAVKDSRVLCNSVMQHAEWRITSNCTHTIADMTNAQVDEFGDLIKSKENGQHHTDTARYLIGTFYPDFIKNPKKYRRD